MLTMQKIRKIINYRIKYVLNTFKIAKICLEITNHFPLLQAVKISMYDTEQNTPTNVT